MASWSTLSLRFDPFAALKPPVQAVLTLLETIEAVLEALLAIIKAFLLDFGNPLRAIIALLLAAVRTLINQLRATGFSMLLVHPDFGRQDFAQTMLSVSGAYPRFESKVVGKFYDASDVFRPQYPSGSAVAMLVLYIGADTPGNLLLQLFSLLNLINHPSILTALPPPVSVKVNPVRKSGDPVAQVRGLFSPDVKNNSLVVEWQMPSNPGGSASYGFTNSLVSFYNSFRFPSFILERSEAPQGEPVFQELNTPVAGSSTAAVVKKYGLQPPSTSLAVREPNGNVYRNFPDKIKVSGPPGGSASTPGFLMSGTFTGTYRFIDEGLTPGKAYFYRVRAYFGDATDYIGAKTVEDVIGNSNLVPKNSGQPVIRYGKGVVMGPPSAVVRGFVPNVLEGVFAFDPYDAIHDAVMAGLLLNFDLPPAPFGASSEETTQRTGWGTLAAAGGQLGPIKQFYRASDRLRDNFLFRTTARRLANSNLSAGMNSSLLTLLSKKWNDGVASTVNRVLNAGFTWTLLGVAGGITDDTEGKVSTYLAEEQGYTSGMKHLSGPYPVLPFSFGGADVSVSADDRRALAGFLQSALMSLSGESTYLAWYSVTLGDLFPAFIPFIFDIEQFILALLKALESALQAIEDIILTIIRKIQALEQLLETILAIIDLLSVNIRLSIFATMSTNGSADSLAQALMDSDDKPSDSPFGLHSGMVLTFGGPGEGAVAAFRALNFLLTLGGSEK